MKRKNKDNIDVLKITKKILKLIYILLWLGVIILAFNILRATNTFKLIGDILITIIPFIIGFIVAWLFEPLIIKFKKLGVPKLLGAIIIYAFIFTILYLVISYVLPNLYNQSNQLFSSLPDLINKLKTFISEFINNEAISTRIIKEISDIVDETLKTLPNAILNMITDFIKGLIVFLIGLIIGLYMILNYELMKKSSIKIIPKKYQKELVCLIKNIGIEVRKCINGTLIVALFVMIVSSIGFIILGLDNPLIYGFICAITDLIPYIGPYIGGFPALVLGFSISNKVGILTIVVLVITQSLENYLFQPLIMSKQTKLNPLVIMLALLIFGKLFGIIGLVLATPLVTLLKVVITFYKDKYLMKCKYVVIDDER